MNGMGVLFQPYGIHQVFQYQQLHNWNDFFPVINRPVDQHLCMIHCTCQNITLRKD